MDRVNGITGGQDYFTMDYVDNTKEYTCLSLCSGYGGLEIGLKRAIPNVRTIAYVEVEAFACANLVAKMEEGKLDAVPVWTDIKTFDGEPFRDKVHFITAGYPCQPFSVAGKRQGTDDPRHLWPYIERLISTIRPVWFFGENVAGHLTIGFPEVYRSLRLMGYKVEAGLFTAAECGAPHRRERLFILAYSSNSTDEQDAQRNEKEGGIQKINRPTLCGRGITRTSKQLADTFRSRLERQPGDDNKRKRQFAYESFQIWPSRPRQPQYEWEEPRVVGNTQNSINGSVHKQGIRKYVVGRCGGKKRVSSKKEIKSRLGGTVNGTKCRVDRLRLLGNGVVPQQAELAFRSLIPLFKD